METALYGNSGDASVDGPELLMAPNCESGYQGMRVDGPEFGSAQYGQGVCQELTGVRQVAYSLCIDDISEVGAVCGSAARTDRTYG